MYPSRLRIVRFEHDGRTVPVALHVPAGPPPTGSSRRALVLFLHGAGERGSQGERLAEVALPRQVRADPAFPHVLLAPQCPSGSHWGEQGPLLEALLEEAVAGLAVDPARVHLTGISMGAAGAWRWAAAAPACFASLVSVCAPWPREGGWPQRAARLAEVPVLAYHGAADEEVLPSQSAALVAAHREAGGRSDLTIYATEGHLCWDRAYAEPAVAALWEGRRG